LEAPSNAQALLWLTREARWPDSRLVVWGVAGCGKTHLLHIWAARVGARCLSGPALQLRLPDIALAIDDADRVPDETVLLHVLNAASEAGAPELLAARTPPAHWSVQLADLASRLRAATAVKIAPPEDSLLRSLLARLLAERQLIVAPSVQEWLLARLPRTPAAIREAAARLDDAALASGRAVTRSLAATVLAELDDLSCR
jgi:chromosomal replication initiation ATPase DnaA